MDKLTTQDKVEIIEERFPDAEFYKGYDDCIIGVLYKSGIEPTILYSEEMIIKKIMSESNLSREDAEDLHANNISFLGGDNSPGFCQEIRDWDIISI